MNISFSVCKSYIFSFSLIHTLLIRIRLMPNFLLNLRLHTFPSGNRWYSWTLNITLSMRKCFVITHILFHALKNPPNKNYINTNTCSSIYSRTSPQKFNRKQLFSPISMLEQISDFHIFSLNVIQIFTCTSNLLKKQTGNAKKMSEATDFDRICF